MGKALRRGLAGPKTQPARPNMSSRRILKYGWPQEILEEVRSKEVAEKVRQGSQSNHERSENLEADLNNLLQVMKKCG